MSELVRTDEVVRKFRHAIPKEHQATLDTRIQWLWNQRFGTVQQVWQSSPDTSEDKLAATIILQAIVASDLNNISLLFRRLEGGSLLDEINLGDVLVV